MVPGVYLSSCMPSSGLSLCHQYPVRTFLMAQVYSLGVSYVVTLYNDGRNSSSEGRKPSFPPKTLENV